MEERETTKVTNQKLNKKCPINTRTKIRERKDSITKAKLKQSTDIKADRENSYEYKISKSLESETDDYGNT